MNSSRADIAPLPLTTVAPVNTENLPRSVYVAVAGLACLPIGLLWDISHHSTIGRDTFWTPAHILIQLGGIVPALLFAAIALKTTSRGTQQARDAAVSFCIASTAVTRFLERLNQSGSMSLSVPCSRAMFSRIWSMQASAFFGSQAA